MSDKELAPISVEVVPVEDLENIRLVANADAGKENNVASESGRTPFSASPRTS